MTRTCQVPWARIGGVRAQRDVLPGNADLRADPGRCRPADPVGLRQGR
jgi:hypothetical protein